MIKTPSFDLAEYAQGDPLANKLALVLPGRLDTKDYVHMRSHVDVLASLGYYALSFDPPGTWESPGDIGLYTTTNILKAVEEIIALYGNKPTVIAGHSRGGSNALLSGVSNPAITHMIAIMSTTGATKVGLPKDGVAVSHSSRDLPPGTARTAEQKKFDLPARYFEDQAQYDSLESLKTCIKPKLFFYGSRDVLVPEATVRIAYESSAEPKMIHTLDAEHDYRLDSTAISEVNETIKLFLYSYPV